ncbi:MAG: glutamine--fructose-6-phosphate transaminase (isomerizing) [Magnetospirillum sp. WYHS-4]
MCGIVGILGKAQAAPLLVEGLRRLEYRGYDSAGLATLVDGRIERRRAEGKLKNLEERLAREPLSGTIGIGHTRWATHGVPNERNAHPHATGKVAVVHNGIIENYRELRAELEAKGCKLASDTDTEVVAHLATLYLDEGLAPPQAAHATLKRLEGAFALAFLFAGHPDLMVAARRGSPLAVGFGDGEMFLGSDALALAPLTQRIMYLEDGDWAVLTPTGATVHDLSGAPVERSVKRTELSGAMTGKGGHAHFMLKEIYEQPQVLGDTLNSFINPATRSMTVPGLDFDLAAIDRVTLIACGTSHYACMTAKYWIEKLARIPVEVDVASEFRYRDHILPKHGLAIFVSQSGETADTLAALRACKAEGQKTISIVNVAESTIARESDVPMVTYAGPEIGVAATKSFTTQLCTLACLAIVLGKARGTLPPEEEAKLVEALVELPSRAAEVLRHDEHLLKLAMELAKARDVLFLGRGTSFPIAMEAALKLKEISYIHAEGFAAGELKHGPIALIDPTIPVIVLAPSDALFDKSASNMEEVIARGARVIFFSDAEGEKKLGRLAAATVTMPQANPFVSPILYAIPVQLLAYHTAVLRGTDVDQPRNLAKSVTVE